MPEDKTTDPLDTPLPCNVRLPGMVLHKGVALRVLVDAATRWKLIADVEFAKGISARALREMQEAFHGKR